MYDGRWMNCLVKWFKKRLGLIVYVLIFSIMFKEFDLTWEKVSIEP